MRPVRSFLPLLLTLAAGLLVWLPAPFWARLAAAGLLAFVLPGWSLLRLAGFRAGDRLEQGVLAVGLSYGLCIVLSLAGLYAVGRLSAPLLAALLGLVSLLLAGGGLWREGYKDPPNPPKGGILFHPPPGGRGGLTWADWLAFLVPVSLAAFFSLTNLGYSDYLGDEMNGLLRAISIIHGRPETLFEHTKGPGEVLLPALFGLLVGRFEPFTLRLPFALAHIAGVGGFYLLGRRLFDRRVGLLAAVLVATNGLYLAFGRMIQYQAVVFLMMALAALLAYHFYRSGETRALGFSAFLAAVGLLAHYDMLLLLPALAYLAWRRSGRRWQPPALALVILLGVTGLFYLPFLLHPHLDRTSSYLGRVVGPSSWPGNNFDELYLFAVMYNSRYYAVFIALLGGGMVLVDLARLLRPPAGSRRLWLSLAGFAGLSLAVVLLGRSAFVPVLLFGLLFLWLIGLTPLSVERRMVYIWLGAAFIGYVFFVDRPRTHLQIIYLPWSLLVALALAGIAGALAGRLGPPGRSWIMAGAAAALALLLALFVAYEYLLFVDTDKEYIFTYPEHRQPWYWEDENFPFGSRRLYGAPHRLGWQMINQLYLQGELDDDWDSNDDGSNLLWYTLGAPRYPCYPRYYFRTQFEQKEDGTEAASPAGLAADYVHVGRVWNRDRLQIDMYEFAPLRPVEEVKQWFEPEHYASFNLPGDFRGLPYEEPAPQAPQPLPQPQLFQPSPPALAEIAGHYDDPRIADVKDKVALLGYELDDRRATPGGLVVLSLYWQAAEVVNLPYKIFAHLASVDNSLWAQSDALPACGSRPAPRWQVGQTVVDRHLLRLPADIPPGDYLIRVGLYEPQTGLRMDLLDTLGNPQGISYDLVRVTVRPGGS